MRFHVVALPHTETTWAFSACAYTAKVINFCRMMKMRGHEVFLYAGEENEAPCDEHIVVARRREQKKHLGDTHYTAARFAGPLWDAANLRAIAEIRLRMQPRDFICVIAGIAQKPIADAFPELLTVEFGVGYGGTFSKYRVFESYAWMHMVYGAETKGNPHLADGNWWDTVIPGYLARESVLPAREPEDYLLYVGRLIDRKGWKIAEEVASALQMRLVVAGPGAASSGVDYRGTVGPEERNRLMNSARAVMVPTIYVEPFANVHVEAMANGAPVVTTDWGVFTETVEQGVTGFRCRNFKEFCEGAQRASELDRQRVQEKALERFSLEPVSRRYEEYFERLATLWGKGWYAE